MPRLVLNRGVQLQRVKTLRVSHLELFPNELRLAFCFGLTSQRFLPCIFCGGGFLSSIFALPDEVLFRSSRMFLLRKRRRCFCLRRTEQTRGRGALLACRSRRGRRLFPLQSSKAPRRPCSLTWKKNALRQCRSLPRLLRLLQRLPVRRSRVR